MEGTNLTAALAGTGLHGPTLFHDEVSPFKSLTAAASERQRVIVYINKSVGSLRSRPLAPGGEVASGA